MTIPTSRRYIACRACYGHGRERSVLTSDNDKLHLPYRDTPLCAVCNGRGFLELVSP